MNPRHTWFLLGTALLLFFFIYFFERHRPSRRNVSQRLVELSLNTIRGIEIDAGTNEVVAAAKTNGTWFLTKPLYPAQQTPIETLITALADLNVSDNVPAREVRREGMKSFGLEPPRARIVLQSSTNRVVVELGNKTVLTNAIYAKLAGASEVLLVDASILDKMPASADFWRDRSLVQVERLNFDHVQIRSGARVVEVEKNPTNRLWHISKPIPARADQERIGGLFRVLKDARVNAFVSDSPGVDLDRYGLQTPELDLVFLQGTNQVMDIQFGASPTNLPTQIFARRSVSSNVVMVDQVLADFLRQPYKNFHDSHLLSLPLEEMDRVEARSVESFILQRRNETNWTILSPYNVAADLNTVSNFITNLASLEIVDLVREVPSEADLNAFGLATPAATYALYDTITNNLGLLTNVLMTRLEFGTNQLDTIAVRRSDETPIYLTRLGDVLGLPRRALDLRERAIWRFAPSNVISLIVSNKGERASIRRNPNGQWSSDPIVNAATEETLLRLGGLNAANWVGKGAQRLRALGISDLSYTLVLELERAGRREEQGISFGTRSPRGTVYASTPLPEESEPVVFEIPGSLYAEILERFPGPGR